jgi:hypothetical protein
MTDSDKSDEPQGIWPNDAMVRPRIEIQGDEGAPSSEIVTPPPNVFSHELIVDERVGPSDTPTDVLSTGTQVLLMSVGGDRCWVVDGVGRHVEINLSSLRPLPHVTQASGENPPIAN